MPDATHINDGSQLVVYASIAIAVQDKDGTWKRYSVLESTGERKAVGAALADLGKRLHDAYGITGWDAGLQYLPTKPRQADGDDRW